MSRPSWQTIGLVKWVIYYVSLMILAPLMLLGFRLRWEGLHKIPREGAFLLLGNHTSLLDPFWGAWPLLRPTRFMASAHLFRFPLIAIPLDAVGGFPKKKFVKDRESMATLSGFIEQGLPVMLFPEGTRSFDGRPGRVLPGIGRLTKRLDTSLVIVRNTTAHLCFPRWARYPRWMPVRLEYEGPLRFEQDATAEEIAAVVREKLSIDHKRLAPKWSLGFRMAHGLESWLWACPSCFAVDGLAPSTQNGNVIACEHCQSQWKVDVSCRLHSLGAASNTDVWDAHDAIKAHFGAPPVIDQRRFEDAGVIISETGSVAVIKRGEDPVELGLGRLELCQTHLRLCRDGGVVWDIPVEDLRAVSIEIANVLQVRTEEQLFQLIPTSRSTIKWAHFLRGWCPNLR